jgi:Ran GTPase-activating protein (RanGAP) involved in mRNA processing and transport
VSATDLSLFFSLAAKCPSLQLLEFRLVGTVSEEDLSALVAAAAPHWQQLEHLDLRGNQLGLPGVQALAAAAQHWKRLRYLHLGGNKLGDQGTHVLAAAAAP